MKLWLLAFVSTPACLGSSDLDMEFGPAAATKSNIQQMCLANTGRWMSFVPPVEIIDGLGNLVGSRVLRATLQIVQLRLVFVMTNFALIVEHLVAEGNIKRELVEQEPKETLHKVPPSYGSNLWQSSGAILPHSAKLPLLVHTQDQYYIK